MTILSIETSCDETAVAVVEGKKDKVLLRANVVASSLAMHAKTGGIIPEVAARAQLKFMLPVLTEALEKAFGYSEADITIKSPPIDEIAVTYGPGLIGPLLIGVETARTLSYVWKKPVIPVNHMMGHIYANFIGETENLVIARRNDEGTYRLVHPEAISLNNGIATAAKRPRNDTRKTLKESVPEFPLLALVVSGGHTDLIYMKQHGDYAVLGGTRDDAAGEAFDKIGRLLGLSYPAGAMIEERAKKGDAKRFCFPRPLIGEQTYDFSFSGLKTAVLREVMVLRHQAGASLQLAPKCSGADYKSAPAQKEENFSAMPRNDTVLNEKTVNDIAAGTQAAIVDVLVKKTLKAAVEFDVKSILLSGGVAANQMLRETFQSEILRQKINSKLYYPPKFLCTDNAAMIASAAYFDYKPIDWKELTANPQLYYE